MVLSVTVSRLASSLGARLARSVVGAAKAAVVPAMATRRFRSDTILKADELIMTVLEVCGAAEVSS